MQAFRRFLPWPLGVVLSAVVGIQRAVDFRRIVYRDVFGGGYCLLVFRIVRALAGGRLVAGSCFRTGRVVSLAGCILLSLVVSW